MKVLADTSVLVTALVQTHPRQEQCARWFIRQKDSQSQLLIAAHTLAEMYSILSSLPMKPRLAPSEVNRLIEEAVLPRAEVVALSVSDYSGVIRRMAELGITGGAVYDALIARAAEKARADKLLTLNARHFRRIWPDGQDIIAEP